MKFKALRPMLWTAEFEQTINFYTSVLGFICGERNDEWGWASLHRDDVEIMVARPTAHSPFEKAAFTGSLYINTDDIDTLWEQLRHTTTIFYPIDNFEYGMREFAIKDNNGYILQFGQVYREM